MTKWSSLENFIHEIEFDKVVDIISQFCSLESGIQKIKSSILYTQFNELQNVHDIHFEFANIIRNQMEFGSRRNDILHLLEHVEIENFYLEASEILQIKKTIENIGACKAFFEKTENANNFPKLHQYFIKIFQDKSLTNLISKQIDEKGIVKDDASPKLLEIRNLQKRIFKDIDQVFRKQVSSYNEMGFLAETVESIRNGRRVLAVKAEKKRSIKGIIHDESESGSIVYIEPNALIELHNDALNIENEEKREIIRILRVLTNQIGTHKKLLLIYQEANTNLDIWKAKAQWAIKMECSPVEIAIQNQIKLIKAFHPLLKYKNSNEGKKTISFDVDLNQNQKMLMISGPNAGGKSITLKSIGLLVLMHQMGYPVPVESGSKLPLLKKYFCDLSDNQSIADELSTYSSKIVRWKQILNEAQSETLILMDEMGSGTDPSFGAAVAQVILESCIEKNSFIVCTTHFGTLKKWADQNKNIINASMLFDEEKLEPLYILKLGKPGSSYTFHIAKKMGLPHELINKAEKLSNTKQVEYDRMLMNLELREKELMKQKEALEQNENEAKKQIKDWKKISNELDLLRNKVKFERMVFLNEKEIEKQKIIKKYQEELKHKEKKEDLKTIEKEVIKTIQSNQEKIKETYKEIHKIPEKQEFKPGDFVQYIQTNAIGKIEKIEKNKAIVIFDHLKSSVPISDLIKLNANPQKSIKPKQKIDVSNTKIDNVLDIRGLFLSEAIEEVEKFVNDSIIQNKFQVKIIHGRGTLRNEIIKLLNKTKVIEKIESASASDGGEGASWITF
jgi:DNA mismatch repair protein MutS2